MTSKPKLGELLVSKQLVSQETVDHALRLQVSGNRRIGHILVQMKAITDDQLAETLASQLGEPIIDIEPEFSPEARTALPRYLCNQYGVLPLRFDANNVLVVAMSNPADEEAIRDIEHYTGKAVEAKLARHSEIGQEIPSRIPLSAKDLFSPKANIITNRMIAVVALLCVFGLGTYTYNYIKIVRHGTISVAGDLILYHNYDLTVAVNKKGSYALQGHGTFADGLYKVEFSDLPSLQAFIKKRDRDFSNQQREWLVWATKQASKVATKEVVAQK